MTSDPRLFVTDFDGTLLSDDRRIHPRDLDTLARLKDNDIITAIATGRSLFSFYRALNQMGLDAERLPVDYLIFSTGAGITSLESGNLLLSRDIPTSGIKEICRCFDGMGFDYMVHKAIPDTPYFLYRENGLNHNPDFYHRIRLYPDFGRPLDAEPTLYDRATEVLAILPGGVRPGTLATIQAHLAGFSVIHATSPLDHRSAWIEVFHPEVSKSRSVGWLARRLGIRQEQVVAVGNDYNDRDLLDWAGLGFLVSNGPEDMKRVFAAVAGNNDCGVSDAARVAELLS
ncbi:MAG TPA: HAD family phosphatase [Desulfobacteraceae bacterium]|nr:HAD family phosphatase [Desulfobacteraceae bacterium]|tara:strand:+ start:3880 stop:4737 length:858 start_codon:yes stop_codon:yes gene_type:complete